MGAVSTCSIRPRGARWIYVVGHGAGAGMRHPFLEEISSRLAARRIATFRYQFPYMEAGRKRPDHARILQATVRAAIARVRYDSDLPLIAGGKSMGGRMTSLALASAGEPGVMGLAFLGFPLHPAKKSASVRGEHLPAIDLPMLFLQGTRDDLADLERMRVLARSLGPRATLHVVDGADHAFHVLVRSGRTDDQVLDELADTLAAWGERILDVPGGPDRPTRPGKARS